jgi:hypothetical protein
MFSLKSSVIAFGAFLFVACVSVAIIVAADRKATTATAVAQSSAAPKPEVTPDQPVVSTVQTARLLTDEQVKWQVISSGGNKGSSTNYILDGTMGQTATGTATSTNYKVNQGFWQNFSSGSCCVGMTGNVNATGIVDLADLSALVSYLTGGGYVLPCVAEANVNNSGIVDLADLSALVSYLTGGGFVLPSCP